MGGGLACRAARLNVGWLQMQLLVGRVAGRPRSVDLILGEPLIRSLRMVYRRNAA